MTTQIGGSALTLVKLKRTGIKPGKAPGLRVYPTGQISVNAAAYRALDKAEHLEVYFAPGGFRLKPVLEPTNDSYKLTGFRAGGATFTAIALVREVAPDLGKPISLPASIDGKMLAISVGNTKA